MLSTASTLGSAASTLGLGLGGASELDGDLALENGLAVQLSNGALGLSWGGESNEGIADGAGGARVSGDGGGLAGNF